MPSSIAFQQGGVGAMAPASPRGADNGEAKGPSGSESGVSAVAAVPIPLRNEWVFWHDKFVANATPAEYTENLREIADVNTVQSFWSVYNNITGPERLTLRCSLHFIHKGVKPLWEDPKNEHGGAWNFRTAKGDTAFVWRELLMALIGEQFEDTIAKGDQIFGLSVSARWNSDIFQIWNMDSSLKENATVMDKVAEILKGVQIQAPFYKAHKDHDHFKM
ncbi:Eukaryotic translation initiation factor 4E type 3 [Entomortierella chlamydospora]|uniref:Eukaryotic translation initiation factor 4E type 3 n=1 Tax=Entomortierella chlamydospora TaxID=101097 RepID=A0A9P6T4U0_9FUNG|nr:Eukaryotic translation initiation factor 4E type 3 [Entomortierella chlamydospora]KAG0024596.1 Eukaryotic translation initiation factor 4E type 3 [Entomortierella chlamydospora]